MLSFTFLNLNAQNTPLNLIPQPVEVVQNVGSFTLNAKTTISYNKPDASGVAEMLVQKFSVPTGLALKAIEGKIGMIQLNLNDTPNTQLGKEGYTFESTPKGIIISANQTAGLFYGMQTLLQLLPKEIESKSVAKATWAIPAVKITDYPRFGWRGIMLDVSRNFFTKAEVKKYIDDIKSIIEAKEWNKLPVSGQINSDIEIFNKKALFIYIKEMTDVQSNTITKVIKKIKVLYINILNKYIENVDY